MTTREIAEKLYEALNSHTNCYYPYRDLYVKDREAFEQAIAELIVPRMTAAVLDKDGDRWERQSDGRWETHQIGGGRTLDDLRVRFGPLRPVPESDPAVSGIQPEPAPDPERQRVWDEYAKLWLQANAANHPHPDALCQDAARFADAMMKARGQ